MAESTRQTMSLPPNQEIFEHLFLLPQPDREASTQVTLVRASCVTRRPATRCSCAFYNLDWAVPFEEGTALP
jgi:hypothetical protein